MKACVTGATGFIGAHVTRLASELGPPVRATYRDETRLSRLADAEVEAVKADVLDRAALRRDFRGCELVFHCAGYVGSRPVERVWQLNALAPRVAVQAAAAEGVRRMVLTSSVAGLGTYPDAKHEGEMEAFAAGARLGVEVVVVNPSYVFGAPVDRMLPGEPSTRMIGNYLRGRLAALVDGQTNVVDVIDVARGHLRAAERGAPGERYVLGGQNLRWVDLLERVAELSGVHHPLLVLPPETATWAHEVQSFDFPAVPSAEGVVLMAQDWRCFSRKGRRELGYRARRLDRTLRDTIDWYRDLIDGCVLGGGRPSPLSVAAAGLRLAGRTGLLTGLRIAEGRLGRRLVVGG